MHSNRTKDRSIIHPYLRSLQNQFVKNRQVKNFAVSFSTFLGLHNSVNLSRERAVTNVGRTSCIACNTLMQQNMFIVTDKTSSVYKNQI